MSPLRVTVSPTTGVLLASVTSTSTAIIVAPAAVAVGPVVYEISLFTQEGETVTFVLEVEDAEKLEVRKFVPCQANVDQ